MKVACIQMDMAFAKPDENFKKAEALVRQAVSKGVDTVVLPETWNIGFFPKEKLSELADCDGQRTRSVFGPLAKALIRLRRVQRPGFLHLLKAPVRSCPAARRDLWQTRRCRKHDPWPF